MPESLDRISLAAAQRPFFCGVDVGGTNIKLGVVDDRGRPIASGAIPTEEPRGPGDAVRRIRESLGQLTEQAGIAWSEIGAVGLGTPGSQDLQRGWILDPPNMPHWQNYPIRDTLGAACERKCGYANDANAAAFGEFWVGAGRGRRNLVMFTLGTGVGGGIILDGRSVDGEHSFGSELGHLVIDCRDDARLCVWGGGRGQLEAYASASAVIARAREALDAGRESSVHSRLAKGASLTPKLLFEEAEAGDNFSMAVILDTAKYLAAGVTSVVHAVDPGVVVIGGAMTFGGHATKTGQAFLDKVRSEFRSRTFDVCLETRIDYAQLGGDAGWIGAAGIGRQQVRQT